LEKHDIDNIFSETNPDSQPQFYNINFEKLIGMNDDDDAVREFMKTQIGLGKKRLFF
jgi:hypothetical protein